MPIDFNALRDLNQTNRSLLTAIQDLSRRVDTSNEQGKDASRGARVTSGGEVAAIRSPLPGLGLSALAQLSGGSPFGSIASGAISGAAVGGVPGAIVGGLSGALKSGQEFVAQRQNAILNAPFGSTQQRLDEESASIRRQKEIEARETGRGIESLVRPFQFFDKNKDQAVMEQRAENAKAARRQFVQDGAVDEVTQMFAGADVNAETMKTVLKATMGQRAEMWKQRLALQGISDQMYGADTNVQAGLNK